MKKLRSVAVLNIYAYSNDWIFHFMFNICPMSCASCLWSKFRSFIYFFLIRQTLHSLVSLSNPVTFTLLLDPPPAVKCIRLPLSEQYDLPFILYQHLKEHSNNTGNLQLIGARRSSLKKHLGSMELHIASTFCAPVTVNEEDHHNGGRCSCSAAHILELQQAVQRCVLVLSREGKPPLSVQLVCLRTWVGERPRCEAGDRGRGGRGGWMDRGIRVDVIRTRCCACQQRLALVHMPTRTRRYIYSCTREQSR